MTQSSNRRLRRYDAKQRAAVLETARACGVVEAQRQHGVPKGTLYKWVARAYEEVGAERWPLYRRYEVVEWSAREGAGRMHCASCAGPFPTELSAQWRPGVGASDLVNGRGAAHSCHAQSGPGLPRTAAPGGPTEHVLSETRASIFPPCPTMEAQEPPRCPPTGDRAGQW